MNDIRIFTMTIASGQTDSNIIDLSSAAFSPLSAAYICSPADLAETVKLRIAANPDSTFFDLQSGGSDISLNAGKATPVAILAGGAVMVKAGSAVGGNRVFTLIGKGSAHWF